MAAGKAAVLLVRPESLRLSATPPAGDAALSATVTRTFYLGSLAEYEIELGGQRLIAVRHDPGEADLYSAGGKRVRTAAAGQHLFVA